MAEHITKAPALIVFIKVSCHFDNEMGEKQELSTGDYVQIETMEKHWMDGIETSQFILVK